MAIGFNIVLGDAKIVNLAYGAQMILNEYIASTLLTILLPPNTRAFHNSYDSCWMAYIDCYVELQEGSNTLYSILNGYSPSNRGVSTEDI
jgi:hypothetical protein